ncbi:MAG TPA: hypothetical protein VLL30_22670, partial [Reyranella sp.]|nr:hypothetical protein [Reyranella sp.]
VPVGNCEGIYEGQDRASGDVRWTGTRADLIFGSRWSDPAAAKAAAASTRVTLPEAVLQRF